MRTKQGSKRNRVFISLSPYLFPSSILSVLSVLSALQCAGDPSPSTPSAITSDPHHQQHITTGENYTPHHWLFCLGVSSSASASSASSSPSFAFAARRPLYSKKIGRAAGRPPDRPGFLSRARSDHIEQYTDLRLITSPCKLNSVLIPTLRAFLCLSPFPVSPIFSR